MNAQGSKNYRLSLPSGIVFSFNTCLLSVFPYASFNVLTVYCSLQADGKLLCQLIFDNPDLVIIFIGFQQLYPEDIMLLDGRVTVIQVQQGSDFVHHIPTFEHQVLSVFLLFPTRYGKGNVTAFTKYEIYFIQQSVYGDA